MKQCTNCGAQVNDNAAFCPKCGARMNVADSAPVQTAPVQPQVMDDEATDVQSNRGIAWLAYVGLLLLVPLFARKRSKYCQFHVKQGATLLAVEIAYYIIRGITLAIIGAIAPAQIKYSQLAGYYYQNSVLYNIFSFIFAVGSIFLLVLGIMGIVNAATGKQKKLLLIGEIPFVEMLMDKIYAGLNK